MTTVTPLAAVDTWRPVMEAAGWRCQCTGGCGKTHAKEPEHRCKATHKPDCLLVASAATPTDNPHADTRGPLVAYCPDCYAGHKRAFNRAQKLVEAPKEPLFGEDGSVPEEVAAVPAAPDDELGRLRAEVARLQANLDYANGHIVHAQEAEEKAWSARSGLAGSLRLTVSSLRELAQTAAADGKPEPTLPVTQVAAALEKALARDRR